MRFILWLSGFLTKLNKHYLQHKKIAEKVIKENVLFFAGLYGVPVKRVAIRNQRTRWGSCSKLGNLNFNYKIMFLPDHLRNMVIVHEICHLLEFNHSQRFWNQVARVFPNYRDLTKQLRKVDMRLIGK
jgi:predicted metal-dependent hydrolase